MKDTSTNYLLIDEAIAKHGCKQSSLISVMQAVQKEYRYLPRPALEYISKKLGVSQAKIYSVATFYENFSLDPKGKYVIKICDGTACHVRKSIPILNAFRKSLGLSADKHTTDDMMFTVETVSCLGACGLAPVITVNDKGYPTMTTEKVEKLLTELKGGQDNEKNS